MSTRPATMAGAVLPGNSTVEFREVPVPGIDCSGTPPARRPALQGTWQWGRCAFVEQAPEACRVMDAGQCGKVVIAFPE